MRHVDIGFFNPEGPLTSDAYVANGSKGGRTDRYVSSRPNCCPSTI